MITKTFTITASPLMMTKIERLLAWLFYNSHWGHSATVAMDLDGDGDDYVEITGMDVCLVPHRDFVSNLGNHRGKMKEVEYIHAGEYNG